MKSVHDLHIRLTTLQKQQLGALAQQRRVSVRALVETATTALLTQASAHPQEGAVSRRLDRLQRQLEATHAQLEVTQGQLDLLTEALAVFVRLYLATTAETPPGQRAEAQQRGTRRYAQFAQALRERLAQDQHLQREVERATPRGSAGAGLEEAGDG